jgi:hypothetical protein
LHCKKKYQKLPNKGRFWYFLAIRRTGDREEAKADIFDYCGLAPK